MCGAKGDGRTCRPNLRTSHERWIEIGPPDYTCVQNTANFIVSAVSITALLIVLARMLRRRFRKQQGGSDRFG